MRIVSPTLLAALLAATFGAHAAPARKAAPTPPPRPAALGAAGLSAQAAAQVPAAAQSAEASGERGAGEAPGQSLAQESTGTQEGDGKNEDKPGTAPLPPARVERPDVPLVRDAVAAYRKGDIAAGDSIRKRVTNAGAGAFLDWAALRLGGAAIGFDRVAAFAHAYPDYPNPAWLRRRHEEALLSERKPAPFVRAFFARERPITGSGKLALALAFRADGLPEDAEELVRDAWRNDNLTRELEARYLDLFKDSLTTADHRFRMERALLKSNWETARRAASYAGDGYDALVKARMAVDGRTRVAEKLVEAVPPALKADTSWLYSRVQHMRRNDKDAEAAKLMAELTRDPAQLVDGDAWWIERRLVARDLLDAGDPKAAYAVVVGHGATSTEKRIEAEFLSGWIALRRVHDLPAARRHFDRAAALAGQPISQARAAYWQGRAAEAAGSRAEAKSFYEAAARHGITYYGQLAAAKLGNPELVFREAPEPPAPPKPLVDAVAFAYEAGFRELGFPLAIDFGRGSTDAAELRGVAAILAGQSDAKAVLTLGKLATQRGQPLDEAAFPTMGIPPFQPVGSNPVEPAMVHAIARQESMFDPAAGSPVGARGLMQLMPGTASATARKAGLTYEPGRILEAEYNAQLGAAHLGDLMEDYRGAYILVFAAYNAGPGNVKKWIAAHGDPRLPGVDPIDWVELIPFSETRNYVQRVMENLQVYRRRLNGPGTLNIQADMKAGAPPKPSAAAEQPARPAALAATP
jgi:soluble lytic murein transglycosylase